MRYEPRLLGGSQWSVHGSLGAPDHPRSQCEIHGSLRLRPAVLPNEATDILLDTGGLATCGSIVPQEATGGVGGGWSECLMGLGHTMACSRSMRSMTCSDVVSTMEEVTPPNESHIPDPQKLEQP